MPPGRGGGGCPPGPERDGRDPARYPRCRWDRGPRRGPGARWRWGRGADSPSPPPPPPGHDPPRVRSRSEEHTSELQSRGHLVCRLLLEKKKENECSENMAQV